jgi:hypothetical protein
MLATTPLLILAILLADGPAPAAKVTYYFGESKVIRADGQPLGNLVSLVKREVIPAESKIVETVLMVSSQPREPVKEYVGVFSVTGAAFTLKEQGGAFEGEGELIGKPWEWTAWNTTSKLPGQRGGTLKSSNKMGGRGMAVSKELFSGDGSLRVKFAEDYAAIDGATYELLRSKLLPRDGK